MRMSTVLKTRRSVLARLAGAALVVVGVNGQGQDATGPAAPGPRFEVVSIKPNTSGSPAISMRQMPDGGYSMVNGSVRSLISAAYSGLSAEPEGLPGWASSDRYDVTATSSLSRPPTPEDRRAMMRAMLAERFNFSAHVETRDQPSYDLVLARADRRLGPAIQPTEIDCAARAAAQRASAEAARTGGAPPPPPAFTPPAPGAAAPPCSMRMTGNVMEGDVTMAGLASFLRPMAGRYVVDKTGLTGSYRIRLEAVRIAAGPAVAPSPAATDDVPSVFTALQEQLGLKLEPSRARVDVLVVDRIERPTAN
jgi:uncharacterized protein (TIGR03435 family)